MCAVIDWFSKMNFRIHWVLRICLTVVPFFIPLVLHDVAISEGDHDPHVIFCTSDVCIVISFIKQPLPETPGKGPAQPLLHRRADLIPSLTELCLWGSPTNPMKRDQTERPRDYRREKDAQKAPSCYVSCYWLGGPEAEPLSLCQELAPPSFLTPRPHKTPDP